MLTYTASLTLIKTTLQSMTIYSTMVFKVPISVCNKIDQICCRFLWAKLNNNKSFSLVAQKDICIDKMQGGLGLRKMKHMSLALRGKLIWNQAIDLQKEWNHIIKQKYMMGE